MPEEVWPGVSVRYEKSVTVNIGQYNSVKLGISDAPCYEECDRVIIDELKLLDIPINDRIKKVLGWPTE